MSDCFATPWTVAHQAPLSMRSPRQEYRSGLPFPSPGDLPDPEIKLASPPWQVDSLPLSHLGSPKHFYNNYHCCCYYYSYYLNRNYHFSYLHYWPPFIMNWILFRALHILKSYLVITTPP